MQSSNYVHYYIFKFIIFISNNLLLLLADPKINKFQIGMYMNPIWSKEGDFPASVKKRILERSLEQGFTTSRLPALSPGEITLLKGYDLYLKKSLSVFPKHETHHHHCSLLNWGH